VTITLKKPAKSARKAKGDGHLRRAEILEAAERIFIAEGYEGATIRKIADEVGVSSTALYMHFRDKAEILMEICEQSIRSLLTINTEIAARPVDPVARVRLMLEAYMRFALDNPNAYLIVFCATPREIVGEKKDLVTDLGELCFERFKGVVAEIAASGRLRTGTVESAAQTLWAAVHGLAALLIARPDFNWSPQDELERVMLDGLLYGLVID